MGNPEITHFVVSYVIPGVLDIEMAQRILLEELSQQLPGAVLKTEDLTSRVRQKVFSGDGPTKDGYTFHPVLNQVKSQITVHEALHMLHATGALFASGPLNQPDDTSVGYTHRSGAGGGIDTPIPLAAVHQSYGLTVAFREKYYRLASGDVYLSYLNQTQLTSRAKRCLQEAINAFRHGLYLSATMNAGAASESMWMELGRLVNVKSPTQKLTDELMKKHPNISTIIEETWSALRHHHATTVLPTIFINATDQIIFKEWADRLRDRRNYAMHSDDAGIEEPRFTHNETGMLLLDAANYYNKLISLVEAMR